MDTRFASPIGVESPATRRADAARNKAVRSTGAPVVTFCAMVPSGLRVAGNNRPYRARQSNRQQNGLIHMRNPYKLTTMRDASARPPKRTYRPTRPSDSAVPKTEVWRGFSEFASGAQAAAYDFGTKTLPTAEDPQAPSCRAVIQVSLPSKYVCWRPATDVYAAVPSPAHRSPPP
jgi:hypothetical protein